MSVYVNYWEWDSAEQCLEWLFKNHKDMQMYKSLHVWQGAAYTLGGGLKTGSYRALTPKMLEGRIYKVNFVNDSIGITYYDRVFIDKISNRSYPDQRICVIVPLPFI